MWIGILLLIIGGLVEIIRKMIYLLVHTLALHVMKKAQVKFFNILDLGLKGMIVGCGISGILFILKDIL